MTINSRVKRGLVMCALVGLLPLGAQVPLPLPPLTRETTSPLGLVIYSDFQCPFCRKAADTVSKLRASYGSALDVIFKHNPLPMHPEAYRLHEAAAAAALQGKFWEMHDLLFAEASAPTRDQLNAMAAKIGLDQAAFNQALENRSAKRQVDRDIAEARAHGAQGTPTFFLNGQKIVGARDFASLKRLIDKELGIVVPVKLTTGSSPVRGAPGAPVTIHVFSDFQCPFCAKVVPALDQVLADYPGQIRLVFKHFPLSFHQDAALAHEAAFAAGEQNKFWEMHDLLFRQQATLKLPDLLRAADQLGLDLDKFRGALESRRYKAEIEADIQEGQVAQVEGTPTIFVNGRSLVGVPSPEGFRKIIDDALAKARLTASAQVLGKSRFIEEQ